MSLPKFTVLGGGSPFTLALIEALAESPEPLTAHHLVLYGRNPVNLNLIKTYGEGRLAPSGWEVSAATDLEAALDGAALVLHQIRYGGLQGRDEAERLVEPYAIPPDETLGPAALLVAGRMAPELRTMGETLHRCCPEAWVINLANPLSATVSLLRRAGVRNCIGLCELPLVTFRMACHLLGIEEREAEWSYVGLNHRGFITSLTRGGEDGLAMLASLTGETELNGIPVRQVAELGAIPLKYHKLFGEGAERQPGRARFLSDLALTILAELADDPHRLPPSLAERNLDWYPEAVVPFLTAITGGEAKIRVVNIETPGGVVEEVKARVSDRGVFPLPADGGTDAVRGWLSAFREHERLFLEAVERPGFESMRAVLRADPLVPNEHADVLANEILARL